MIIDKRCFKIDKPNALVMIAGFRKHGRIHHQSIWVDVAKKPFPMLITLNRTPTRFQLSRLGKNLALERYSMPLKYIALLDSQYFIRNDIELWETVCSNGLFNIWDPVAPYNRLTEAKTDPSRFRIQLLRIYEINEEFSSDDIVAASSRIDHLTFSNRKVTIKRPVIPEDEFQHLKELLVDSVSAYQLHKRLKTSISQIKRDVDSQEFEDEFFEGRKKKRYSSFYERNPRLRLAAIRHHGTKCKICGFDFQEMYGQRGNGFIEAHHLIPVSQLRKVRKVNPRKEMTVVCSNCHRMIHRDKNNILSPEQLREILRYEWDT
jgi:5-methylcytosine-specific restriction protein A